MRYYDLMIKHALQGNDFLNTCKYYRQIYNSKSVQSNESQWKEVNKFFQDIVILLLNYNEKGLAKFGPVCDFGSF